MFPFSFLYVTDTEGLASEHPALAYPFASPSPQTPAPIRNPARVGPNALFPLPLNHLPAHPTHQCLLHRPMEIPMLIPLITRSRHGAMNTPCRNPGDRPLRNAIYQLAGGSPDGQALSRLLSWGASEISHPLVLCAFVAHRIIRVSVNR